MFFGEAREAPLFWTSWDRTEWITLCIVAGLLSLRFGYQEFRMNDVVPRAERIDRTGPYVVGGCAFVSVASGMYAWLAYL